MDFETAFKVSQDIEREHAPNVIAVGFRRQRWDAPDSWAVDLLNSDTGQMVTLDEKDDWEVRLKGLVQEKPKEDRHAS
jgi:hypothetical protein